MTEEIKYEGTQRRKKNMKKTRQMGGRKREKERNR